MAEYNVVRLRGIIDEELKEIPLRTRGTLTELKLRTGVGTKWETVYTIAVIGDRKAFLLSLGKGDEIDCTCWLNSRESAFGVSKYYLNLSLREISETRPAVAASAPPADNAHPGAGPPDAATTEPAPPDDLWGDSLPF